MHYPPHLRRAAVDCRSTAAADVAQSERLNPSRSRVLHRAEQVDLLRRSTFFVGSDRLLNRQFARLALCLQVGQRCLETLSEGRALKVRVAERKGAGPEYGACAVL